MRNLYWVAVAVYVISLILPGFVTDQSDGTWFGYHILVAGELGMLLGQFAWLANLIALAAVVAAAIEMYVFGAVLSVAAFGVGLHSLLFTGARYPLDEAGVRNATVDHLGKGFYVWEFSFLLLLAYCVAMLVARTRKTS